MRGMLLSRAYRRGFMREFSSAFLWNLSVRGPVRGIPIFTSSNGNGRFEWEHLRPTKHLVLDTPQWQSPRFASAFWTTR
jgi:hypothetical protein